MAKREFDLKTILDIPIWEKVQDQISKITGTAVMTVDYKGIPLTKHSGRSEFCTVVRENPLLRKRCYRCAALAGLEAVRLERPYVYLCHCGIVDVAVPVMVGERYLGSVLIGQVRIAREDVDNKVERLVNELCSFQAGEEEGRMDLLAMYERLPEMEYNRILEIAEFVSTLIDYIVERAVSSRNQCDTYEWLLNMSKDEEGGDIQELRAPGSENIATEKAEAEMPVPMSSALYPALVYIREHPTGDVSMKEMAELCRLSPSYFSRLFNRELGESFVTYVNRKKVERAKELLRDTNHSISQISGEVGYQNVSHFIDVFKRMEGVTPSVFRQHRGK